MTTTPASVTTRNRDRHYRRGTTPRSTASSSAMDRDGARTPLDGMGTATPAANDDDSHDINDTSYRNNQSFRSTSSSLPFMSPPLDPRAGGGSMAGRSRRVHSIRSPRHYQRQSIEMSAYNIDTAATPTAGEEEYVTPPANTATSQTPGHGHIEDVYTQRRGASQRRRRRGWDEVNI